MEGFPFFFSNTSITNELPLLLQETTIVNRIPIEAVENNLVKPKYTPQQLDRFNLGRQVEAEQLQEMGLEKNNQGFDFVDPKTNKIGRTIPDALENEGQSTVEVKHVKYQGLDKQLRGQREISNENGFNPKLRINEDAVISKPVRNSFNIETYKGPPLKADALQPINNEKLSETERNKLIDFIKKNESKQN